MFNEKEQAILNYANTQGKSKEEAVAAIAQFRRESEKPALNQNSGDRKKSVSLMQQTGNVLDTVFGGGKIGAKLGEHIAKGSFGDTIQKAVVGSDLSPEVEALVSPTVTGKQVFGDVVRAGSLFLPFGKMAKGIGAGANALGIGASAAQTVGQIGAGAGIGAIADIGNSVAEGGEPKLGAGTIIGGAIPALSPMVKGVTKFMAKFGGKIGSEIQGAVTGTSSETIEQAFNVARKGGKDLDAFTNAMRGQTTPEQLVTNLRENVSIVNTQRQQMFSQTLAELGDTVVDSAPAKSGFVVKLKEAGISITENGTLDFTGSKLRLVPQAQAKLQTAFADLMNTPGQATLSDIDTTRQALKALSLSGDDPSANLANKLLEDAVRSVRSVGEQVPEYKTMLDQFAETSEFLDELQRGLSSGDRATVDQTYRRMATALKTNNEARLSLVQELDKMTDGSILSEIAGQQLSEAMPRGIIRAFAASMGGAGFIVGGTPAASAAIIPLLVASPRVTGEFVRALGIGARQTDELIKAITEVQGLLVKVGAIGAAEIGSEQDN